jgi:autotransporter passenger strand-loop-strand repeat protein
VSAGGADIGATISAGGVETVSSAGAANADTIAASGSLQLDSGATAAGGITFAGADASLGIGGDVMPTTPIGGFAASDSIVLSGMAYDAANSWTVSGDSLTVSGPGGLVDTLDITGASSDYFTLDSSDGATEIMLANAPAATNFAVTDVSTGSSGVFQGDVYDGPVSYLQDQYSYTGPDNVAIAAAVPDVFVYTGAGDDAIQVAGGSNVLDAGSGSNFLVGASGADGGADTFFLDAGNPQPTWDTLVNFHPRDMLTIWDFMQGVGTTKWLADGAGASGYQGATLQINAGAGSSPNELVTFAGLSTQTAQFDITSGTTGGLDYLAVTRIS